MKIYVFQNSYYIGNDTNVTKNALRSEDITVPEGETIQVKNGEVILVDEEVGYAIS